MIRPGYHTEQISKKALESILETLTQRQKAVYQVIVKWEPVSNERIAEHLNVPLHHVTPRTGELRDLGIIEFCGEEKSKHSGRSISLFRINPDGKQLSLW